MLAHARLNKNLNTKSSVEFLHQITLFMERIISMSKNLKQNAAVGTELESGILLHFHTSQSCHGCVA